MTKRLILIRHAKSSWNDPFADDHARVLNARGRDSATAIGGWMAEKGYIPQRVLCSNAARTQETAKLLLPSLLPAPELVLTGALYHAAPQTILELVQRQETDTLAVIGHNPGIGMLASALVNAAPRHRRFADYPTCATAVIDFDVDQWSKVETRSGICIDFVVPRDVIGATDDPD